MAIKIKTFIKYLELVATIICMMLLTVLALKYDSDLYILPPLYVADYLHKFYAKGKRLKLVKE